MFERWSWGSGPKRDWKERNNFKSQLVYPTPQSSSNSPPPLLAGTKPHDWYRSEKSNLFHQKGTRNCFKFVRKTLHFSNFSKLTLQKHNNYVKSTRKYVVRILSRCHLSAKREHRIQLPAIERINAVNQHDSRCVRIILLFKIFVLQRWFSNGT